MLEMQKEMMYVLHVFPNSHFLFDAFLFSKAYFLNH